MKKVSKVFCFGRLANVCNTNNYRVSKKDCLVDFTKAFRVGVKSTKLKVNAEVNSALTVDLASGASTATLTDASSFAIGDGIKFTDSSSSADGYLYTITNIIGNIITFTPGATQGYQTAQGASCHLVPPLIAISRNDDTPLYDISVENLFLDGNKANITNKINWNGSCGIHLWEAFRTKIHKCKIINTKNDSIQTSNCEAVKITETYIEESGNYGVHWGDRSHDCSFERGHIKNSGNSPILWCAGIYNCHALNSVFEQTTTIRIMYLGGDLLFPDYRNSIIGNDFRNVKIWVDGGITNSQRTTIADNSFIFSIVQATGAWVIYVGAGVEGAGSPENLVIDNNFITDTQASPTLSYGIYVIYTNTHYPKHITISNNVILNVNLGDGRGIYLSSVEDINISGNYISNCVVGISISGGANNIITNNTIENNSYAGIWARGSRAVISNNLIKDNGNAIILGNGDDMVITGNIIEKLSPTQLYGVRNSSGESADRITISDNWFSGGFTSAILLYGSDAKITNNYVNACTSNGMNVIGDRILIHGNKCQANTQGIRLTGSDSKIEGNSLYNNTLSGIYLSGSYNTIMGNICRDGQETKTQDYGIEEVAGDFNIYIGNQIHGWQIAAVSLVGANNLPVPANFTTMNITTA